MTSHQNCPNLNRTTIYLAITILGIFPKEMKPLPQRDICTPMFTAEYSQYSRYGNNLGVCQKMVQDHVVYKYNGIAFQPLKRGILSFANNLDEPGGHYAI